MKARPTTYKGVDMRSRLEAGFAQWLDQHNVRWEYEPKAFADENGQYLPDFLLRDLWVFGETADVYVEVKPRISHEVLREVTARMPIIWRSEPNAALVLVAGEGSQLRPAGSGQPLILTEHLDLPSYMRLDFEAAKWTLVRRQDATPTVGIGSWVNAPWPRLWWEGRG
jgi:hypothetical protein